MRKVTCMCENAFEADLPEEIDLDAESGRLAEILEGRFFRVTCPRCGAVLKPELAVRLQSARLGQDIRVLPELDRLAFYLGKLPQPKGAEVLIGYAELFERARILADGLDPVAIEIVKYYLSLKAGEKAPDGAEISVAYAGLKAEGGETKLLFHVRGVKEGEVAVLPVGRDFYDKSLSDKRRTLQGEPFSRFLAGPYKSIRALEAEE